MKDFFKQCWDDGRPRVSFISGVPVNFAPITFAHVISKGAYPGYRKNPENIVFLTPTEHILYDHRTDKARENERFDKLFELADRLREQYNKEHNNYGTYRKDK